MTHGAGSAGGEPEQSSATALPLLVAGAMLGIALAALGLLGPAARSGASLPPGVVATVNGRVLPASAFEHALAALEADAREPVAAPERRALLERMVDEELLVQRGLDLGLLELDRRLRGELVHAVIDNALAGSLRDEPSSEQVAVFYADNADHFRQADALLVRQVFLRMAARADAAGRDDVRRRAEQARARLLAGEDITVVAAEWGDPAVVPLPEVYLRPAKLRDYLGATALRAVLALEVGGVSDPVRSVAGLHVYQLAGRKPAAVAALADIEELVRGEYRRRGDDEALRAFIAELRAQAEIRLVENP